MNPEKNEVNNQLIIDTFIQDQTRKPEKVKVNIYPQDEMYLYALKNTEGNIDEALLRYFSNGKRILDAVKQIVEWHFDGFENISSFLDFASGYGRFSRFLVQEIPAHKIWISDIYSQAVEFQKKLLGVEGIVSTNHPEDYQLNQKFDCIFACSFFSHTPQKTFSGWLEKLYSLLTEKGILIFSTHDLSLMTIEIETDAEEIYFTPESESIFLKTEDYGVTYVGEKWVGKIIHQATKGKAKWHRIKKGLCGYHDLYILWKEEGRRKKEEGRRKKEEVIKSKVKSQNSEVGKEEAINSKFKSQNSEVGKEEVEKGEAINSKFKSQNSEVGKEEAINSKFKSQNSEVGKEEAINSKLKSQNSEVRKEEVIKEEVEKGEFEEQRDKLLNFYCHPDGGCRSIEVTPTGDIYIEGWAADINPEEKVEEVAVLVNGIKVKSCLLKYESKIQKYQWSCSINSEHLSPDDVILVKIINNFHLERVVNISPVNSIVLLPPNHLLLRISGNSSVKAFLSSFDDLKYTVKNYLQKAGFDFHQFENILDFGCGVGRYLMAFKPELLPNQKLFGCDVFPECAEWCEENIKFATVKHNDIQPPLPFENNQFDLVNAVSVFTHLRLDLQHLWAWDIYRVLRPGGILFMTLHGPQFFPIVYDIFRTGNTHQAEMYSIGEEGLFLYLDHQGETDGQGQHTVAALHTPAAYQEIFSMFKHIKRFPQSTMANGQDLYILQKPISGGLVAQPLRRKKEEGRRKKEEVFIKSEVRSQKLEVKNFGKKEEVGNAKEEIIGKNIEVEKILISDNEETKNLSDKILSDSQTKRQVKTEVEELPFFDGEETWKFAEKILPGSDKCQTEIKFQIEGQKRFRVYPQIEPIAAYSIECEIEIIKSEDGKILVQKTIAFNHNHIFGKTNYAVVEIEIPRYFGEVVVRLNAVITDRISLAAKQEVMVSWNFANFAEYQEKN
ncbi:MAG: methyltransferase [Okeania sp. SIO3C4]|nr:methyltransferase [Okeania sp. SIO3B3]NER03227.1 methyltransferase [Okeania sp. SIO3C4]